jgi:rfaE bifunctional protein kinase chain/domain
MNHRLKEILGTFKDKRIIVWGDLILDEYIYTTTGRISREAPVLVTEFESNSFRLGGAGNVVMNINALGAAPVPVGFVGNNMDGEILRNILESHSISTDFLVSPQDFRTPKKSRILSGGDHTKKQQVLRIDTLNRSGIDKNAYRKLESTLSQLLEEIDLMIMSDYLHQSVSPPVLKKLRESFPAKTVIIDSRNHLPKFKDISIATPNEPEIKTIFPGRNFFHDEDFYFAGKELLERLNARGIIIKRGHKGMIVFEREKEPEVIGIHGSTDIVDVTGAGDTVISVLGLALSAGADLVSSAKLANTAAGFVVMKEGAYPIGLQELEHELK